MAELRSGAESMYSRREPDDGTFSMVWDMPGLAKSCCQRICRVLGSTAQTKADWPPMPPPPIVIPAT